MVRKPTATFATASDGAVLLALHVRPAASAEHIGRVDPWRGRLEVQVRAPPERGEANDAVCTLLASRLGVPANHVTVVGGPRSREKVVRIEGLDEAAVRAALEASR
jgi:uncharacterized protein (TIGR00251 family)